MSMEYLRGWRVLRQDPQWMGKVGVGTVLVLSTMCIPIAGNVALVGWKSLALRRAVSGQESPLPRLDFDFDYLGKLFNSGFKGFLATMLWTLPLVAIVMASMCCLYVGFGGAIAVAGAGAASGSDAGAALGGLGATCIGLGVCAIYPVIIIGVTLPMQIAVMRAELTDDLNQAMRLKEVFAMTRLLLKELIVGHLIMSVVGMIAGMFGLITLYIGLFPAIIVMQVLQTYFHAELYKAYLEKGGKPLPIGPLDVPGGNLQPQPPAQPGAYPQF